MRKRKGKKLYGASKDKIIKRKKEHCCHGGIWILHRFNDKLFKEHAEQIKSFRLRQNDILFLDTDLLGYILAEALLVGSELDVDKH